jgi:hypothetical protein
MLGLAPVIGVMTAATRQCDSQRSVSANALPMVATPTESHAT